MTSTARQPESERTFAASVILSIETILRTRDISQAELARRSGMSEAQVSRRLHDNPDNLTLNEALGMANAVDRPLDALMDPETIAAEEFKLVRGMLKGYANRSLPGIGEPDLRVLKGDR